MILKIIFTLFVIYYLIILFILQKQEKYRGKPPAPAPDILPEPEPLIGKSTFVWKEPEPAPEPPQKEEEIYIPDDEDVEVYEPYMGDEDEDQDHSDSPPGDFSTGVTFDELGQFVEVITDKKTTPEEVEQATSTLEKLQDCTVLQNLIDQIPGGKDKVEKLLRKRFSRYQQEEETEPEIDSVNKEKLQTFNISDHV